MFLVVLTFLSCRRENEEELFKDFLNDSLLCDTAYVNYNIHIKGIFDAKCISCHQQDWVPGCDLDSFPSIMEYMNGTDDRLYTYIENNDHQGAVLTPCELIQIKKWILNPAP
jgi:hypothetical protein